MGSLGLKTKQHNTKTSNNWIKNSRIKKKVGDDLQKSESNLETSGYGTANDPSDVYLILQESLKLKTKRELAVSDGIAGCG